MRFCTASGKPVAYRKDQVTATNRHTGRPRKALVTCRRCHRTNLTATIHWPQVGVGSGEDGVATMPHHYRREEI